MLKKSIIFCIVLFLCKPAFSNENKLIYGIAMTVVGFACASQGFQQVEKTQTQNISIDVNYTWTTKEVNEEWDYNYKFETYKNGTYQSTTNLTADPNTSNIAYQWTYSDFWDVNTADTYAWVKYMNHHITYNTVTHFGTDTVVKSVTTIYKEYKDTNQGIGGICLMSLGINQLISYFEEDTKLAKLNIPEIKVSALNGQIKMLACFRI